MKILKAFLVFLIIVLMVTLGEARLRARTSNVLPTRTLFSEPVKDIPGPEMNYTGFRVRDDSMLVIYYYDQTIAVVEVGQNRELYNCELLEVKTKEDRMTALTSLKEKIPNQMEISSTDMTALMSQCQKIQIEINMNMYPITMEEDNQNMQMENSNDSSSLATLFRGVFPGTKWCGSGNVAMSYHDLGAEKELDKCCRTHDFCPVKVSAFRTQYNITNISFYTKSHCGCDDTFYNCLKIVASKAANIVGNVFFNILKAVCVEDIPPDPITGATKKFVKRKKYF